jgi:hypothetical protein
MITPGFVSVWVNIMHEICCSMKLMHGFVPGHFIVTRGFVPRWDGFVLAGYWDVSYNKRLGAGMDCNVGLHCADMYNSTRVCGSMGYTCVCLVLAWFVPTRVTVRNGFVRIGDNNARPCAFMRCYNAQLCAGRVAIMHGAVQE